VEHSWLGSAVDNWILKFLIEEQLGVGLKMVSSNDLPPAVYGDSFFVNDTLHIDLEYWVYPPDPWYDSQVGDNLSVVDVGPSGFAATTGYYIPTYLTATTYWDGQLDYWRMYRMPDVAAFFATAATNYSSGEWAGGFDYWGPDAYMLQNLKMNFTPIWYGNDLLPHLYAVYLLQAPLFIYLWTPLGVWRTMYNTLVDVKICIQCIHRSITIFNS